MVNEYLKEYEISGRAYDDKMRKIVRSQKTLPEIHLVGVCSQAEDSKLFEEISHYRNKSTRKMTLRMMYFDELTKKPRLFPLLSKLIFNNCRIKDGQLLQFNEWCPNITELVFFSVTFTDEVYNAFISNEHALVHVESLDFNFITGIKLSREFLAAIDKKFPSLESLNLTSVPTNLSRLIYEPLYFQNIRKLSLSMSGSSDVSTVFDFLAVSNQGLEELEFKCQTIPGKLLKWIESCKKLKKLTLNCWDLVLERDLHNLEELPWLEEIKLNVEHHRWNAEQMIGFASKHPRLQLIDIQSERTHDEMDFDDDGIDFYDYMREFIDLYDDKMNFNKYKKAFKDLVEKRGKLTFRVNQVEYTKNGQKDCRKRQIPERGAKNKTRKLETDDNNCRRRDWKDDYLWY